MLCLLLCGIAPIQLAAQSPQTSPSQATARAMEAQFLRGLAALNAGRPSEAIPIFLSLLAADPGLVRVRLELARAYYDAELWSRARQEFFTVLSGDLPEIVRFRVLSFIRAIDARRGFDWDLSIALTTVGETRNFDTDVVDATLGFGVIPVTLDRDTESDLGLRVTGSMAYRQALDSTLIPGTETVAFVGGNIDLKDGPAARFDDTILGVDAGLRFLGAQTSVALSAFGSTRYFAHERVEDRYGARLVFERRSLLGGSVFGSASLAKLESARSADLSGMVLTTELGFRRALGGRASIGAAIRYEDNRVRNNNGDYADSQIRLFGSLDADFGLTLSPTLYARVRNFHNQAPGFLQDRDERAIGVVLTVQKSDIFIGDGFSPFARVSHERGTSDIDAFSYTETEFLLGLERRF